jgi:hypothetical protein
MAKVYIELFIRDKRCSM